MSHTTTDPTTVATGWDTTYLGFPAVQHRLIRMRAGCIHVSSSPLSAVRQAIAACPAKHPFFSMPKGNRRYYIAAILQQHAFNRAEYQAVMRGKVALLDAWQPRYFFDKSDNSTLIA